MKRENSIPLTVRIPIRNRQGEVVGEKEVASYAGLLAKAHEEGLSAVTTEIVQQPTPENGEVAIVRAHVITSKGAFTGIGDASPSNVNARIAPHLLRMAETRAKARALRDAVNIGVVSLEELGADAGSELAEYTGGNGVAAAASASEEQSRAPSRTRTARPNGNGNGDARGNGAKGSGRTPYAVASASVPNNGAGTGGGGGDRIPQQTLGMTESQRRFLYRLASDLGIEGEATLGFLLEALKADDLRHVSRQAASALIDRLKGEVDARAADGAGGRTHGGGQGNGAAVPF